MNIRNIMKQAVAAGRSWRIKPVPGAIALFEHGKPKVFLGLPIDELFPETGALRKWLDTSQTAREENVWQHMFGGGNLAPRRREHIEGFGRFGVAHRMRKKLTRFGSGWQGIEDVLQRQASSPFSIRPYARAIQNAYKLRPETPVGQVEENISASYGRAAIQPTRRQSLELAVEAAPFMTKPEVRFAGKGAESDVYSLGSGQVLKLSQPLEGGLGVEELRGTAGILHPSYHKQFEGFEAGIYPEAIPLNTKVAEGSAEFVSNEKRVVELFQTLHKQGILWQDPTARNVGMIGERVFALDAGKMKRIGESVSSAVASGKTAAIEGLAEGGMAKVVRKALTSFGSGWQGPGEEKAVRDTFERVVGRNFQIDQPAIDQLWETAKPFIRTDKVSFLGGGQEHMVFDIGEKDVIKIGYGKSIPIPKENEFLQARKTIDIMTEGTSYRGGIHAHVMPRVDTAGITFEEQKMATDALKAKGWAIDAAEGNFGRVGKYIKVIDHGQMTKIAEHVMETGEGAAISQAGTSAVKAVFKAGSRVIKNAL